MKAKTKQEELRNEAAEEGQADGFSDPSVQPEFASAQSSLEDRIRQRAYEFSQQRDTYGGDAVSDWYRAEAEVRAAFSSPEMDGLTEPEEGDRSLSASAS